ncbi:hypothetical protein SBY92_000397 [Candida maltosa Xu316]
MLYNRYYELLNGKNIEINKEFVNLVKELLLKDPKKVVQLYRSLQDGKLISQAKIKICQSLSNDPIRLSIWQYIATRKSSKNVLTIISNLKMLVETKDINALFNYLQKLTSTGILNTRPIILSSTDFQNMLDAVPNDQHALLYSYMVHLNLQTGNKYKMDSFKRKLWRGSNMDKYILQTGLILPNYKRTNDFELSDMQRDKLVHFCTIQDFEHFVNTSITINEPFRANFYLDCMLRKFELKCSTKRRIINDTNIKEDVIILLKSVINLVMKFKGGETCIKVLKYMVNENLKLDFDIYLLLLKNLKSLGNFEEFIVVLNHINLGNLTATQKQIIGDEILSLMQTRFPTSPKVIIGYVGALFGQEGLKTLNNLKILGIPFGAGGPRVLPTIDMVQIATVDSQMKGLPLTPNSLAYVYQVLLASINDVQNSPQIIWELFEEYQKFIINHTWDKLDDRVITVFLNHLLRTDEEGVKLPITSKLENYEVAKRITTYYSVQSGRISSLNIELLIQTALLIHKDYLFALKVLQISRTNKMRFTFNQLYPFIKYHYDHKEYDKAKSWYNELIKSGAGSSGPMLTELFNIAKELNWDNKGRKYKFNISRNKKKNKEALTKINLDSMLFANTNNKSLDDELLDDILVSDTDNNRDFAMELGSLLSQMNQK